MYLRALVFLAIVSTFGWLGFRALIDDEVRRVVAVHAVDKASHLADMLEANPVAIAKFETTEPFTTDGLAEFLAMAHGIRVHSVFFFDTAGERIGRAVTAAAMTHPGPASAHHAHHARPVSGGQTADLMSQAREVTKADLRNLLQGRASSVVMVDRIQGGGTAQYANVVLPIMVSGSVAGYVGLTFNVSEIHGVYAQGVLSFGLFFTVCGAILFGVPALGFWLQKQLAERSSRNAQYLARHDALTGLLNRNAFAQAAQSRLNEGKLGHMIYLDVDRFKQINDFNGHKVGDEYLIYLANLLSNHFTSAALISRFGGDEFAVALPRMPRPDVEAMIATLMSEVREDIKIDGINLSTTLSLGLAEPAQDESLDSLIQRSDTALYSAKASGRDLAAFYTEDMGEAARRRRVLEDRLKEALRDDGFALAYQPLVDAKDLRIVGYEALLRLNDPEGVSILPEEFIPVAEDVGLIEPIGAWVLNKAMQDISNLDDHSKVSINLSVNQFKSGRLIEIVRAALQQSALPPQRLELEITENILMGEDANAKFQIDTLKEMGISIAIDDFGTGFSSLWTLWKYGFDRIKIDKSFIHALKDAPERSRELIDTIVLLGSRMGMSVTAEGVETKSQNDILVELGCSVLQGHYFGRPAPISDVRRARKVS